MPVDDDFSKNPKRHARSVVGLARAVVADKAHDSPALTVMTNCQISLLPPVSIQAFEKLVMVKA